MPDPSPWAEFGLAGLFALFALTLIVILLRYIKDINTQWQEFLKSEKEQRLQSMTRGLDAVSEITKAISGLANVIGAHDGNAQDRHEAVMEKLKDIAEALDRILRRKR